MNKSLVIIVFVLLSFDFILSYNVLVKKNSFLINQNVCIENEEKSDSIFFDYLELIAQDVELNNLVNYIVSKQDIAPVLIYVFSEDDCSQCVLEDISLIKEYINNLSKVFVFPVFEDTRTNNIRLKADLNGFNYKRIDKDQVQLYTKNGVKVRFFAVVKPNGQIIYPFFPGEMKTKKYLNFVVNSSFFAVR